MSPLERVEPRAEHQAPVEHRLDKGGEIPSPWLTSQEACSYLRFTGKARLISLYRFLKRQGVPRAYVGGRLRIARRDLDRAIGAGHRRTA